MSHISPEGAAQPAPVATEVTRIETLRLLDAEGLRQYAHETPDPQVSDPIRSLVRTAFKASDPIAIDRALPLIHDVGEQINEPTIPPILATWLRTVTDEGVYPERLGSVEGWAATAKIFESHRERLRHAAARFLVTAMGIDRPLLAEALSANEENFWLSGYNFARGIRNRPSTHEALANMVAGMMRPLVLTQFPPRRNQEKHLEEALVPVLRSPRGIAIHRSATIAQQSAIIDAMSMKYLDRPLLVEPVGGDPQRTISALRRFCSGESRVAIARSEGVIDPSGVGHRLRKVLGALRNAITQTDMQRMEQFIAGKTSDLVLERSDPAWAIRRRQKPKRK